MLDHSFRELLNGLVHPRFEQCDGMFQQDFARKSAELAERGHISPASTLQVHHYACINQVECKIPIVWESIKRLVEDLGISYYDTLEADLKERVDYYVPVDLWGLRRSYEKYSKLNVALIQLQSELLTKREKMLQMIYGEIAVVVKGLHVKGQKVQKATIEDVHTLPEQENLLSILVEASRSVPKPEKFIVIKTMGRTHVKHAGLPSGEHDLHIGDVEALAGQGLLEPSAEQKGVTQYHLTAKGIKYYEQLKQTADRSIQMVQAEIRNYLEVGMFQRNYPDAYLKWMAAEKSLWCADTEHHFTTIGHLCREAMQEFVNTLVEKFQPSHVDQDQAHTVSRVRSVLDHRKAQVGEAKHALLGALLTYWGATSDLVVRQVHGAKKEGDTLTWEDARRVTFQTLLAMYEIARAL